MKHYLLCAALLAVSLGGCVSLGLSQQDSETAYTIATIGGDAFILSGKATPDQAGQACVADNVTYNILVSSRNIADGVNYSPADNAHAALQRDGARLAPDKCVPVTPPD